MFAPIEKNWLCHITCLCLNWLIYISQDITMNSYYFIVELTICVSLCSAIQAKKENLMALRRWWTKIKSSTIIALGRHKTRTFWLPNFQKIHRGACKFIHRSIHLLDCVPNICSADNLFCFCPLHISGQRRWAIVESIWLWRWSRLAAIICCILLIWKRTVKFGEKFHSHPLLPNLKPIMM